MSHIRKEHRLVFDTKSATLRLRVVGLTPVQADQIVKLVQKWIVANGEEETVKRIKAIKVNLLHHFAGLAPTNYHSWTRQHRDGSPKGPFGCLFRLSKKQFRTAWNSVMVYTGIARDARLGVTAKQWKGMVDAIRRPPLEPEVLVQGLRVVHQSPFFVACHVGRDTGNPLLDYQPSPSRRAPLGFRTVPEIAGVVDSVRCLTDRPLWTIANWDILSGTLRGMEELNREVLECNLADEARSEGTVPSDLFPRMGIISLLQEGGYKLRFAANPYRVYQKALEPLGMALYGALRRTPNDFTFDQTAALPLIQKWAGEGRTLCSMDLSNCSDNLPLDLQLEALSRYGVGTRWLQFFRDCCQGTWDVKPRDQWLVLQWSVGTPLGLFPTFPAFALLHHSIVQWCFQESGQFKEDGIYPYTIVGDDVVIAHRETGERYRNFMNALGVPISEHKTLWSEGTAEFIGRVITEKSVVQGFKWKGRTTDDSFVEHLRQFGPRALALLTPRQRKVVRFIADLPEPHGLGWNPFGIPLEERWTPALERVWVRDERKRDFRGRAARANRLLYSSEYAKGAPLPGIHADADVLSSDQEDSELVWSLMPGLEGWGPAIWPNLPAVAPLRDMSPETDMLYRDLLKRTSYVETRKEASALVVLERKVRRSLNLWKRQGFHP